MTERHATKFKDAAREAEGDEDEARWTEQLKKAAKQQPDEQGGQ